MAEGTTLDLRRPSVALTLLAAGLLEAYVWLSGSLTNPPPAFGWIPGWIDKMAEHATFPPARFVLERLVLPNMAFALWFTFLLGLVLGVAFLLGAFVRVAGVVGGVWALLITIGSFPVPSDEPPYAHAMFVLLPFLLGALGAGRVWGADGWIRRRAHDRRLLAMT